MTGASGLVFLCILLSTLLLTSAGRAKCPNTPGYLVSPDLVVDGGDVETYTDLTSATAACDKLASCFGVGGNGTLFSLKDVPIIPTRMGPGACLYSKLMTTACPRQPDYTAIADAVPHLSGTIDLAVSKSLSAVKTACGLTSACLGFHGRTYSAYSTYYPMSYVKGTCMYKKVTTSCPSLPGYSAEPDVLVQDKTLKQTPAGGERPVCNLDPACIGFNNNGGLKSSSSVQSYKYAACYFSKTNDLTGLVCPDIAGFTAVKNQELSAPALAKFKDAATAASSCAATSGCAGFSQNGWVTRRNTTARLKYTYSYFNCFYLKMATSA